MRRNAESMQKNYEEDGASNEIGERLWDKRQTAQFLGVTPRTLENWMRDNRIPFFRISRSVRFRKDDLLRRLAIHSSK